MRVAHDRVRGGTGCKSARVQRKDAQKVAQCFGIEERYISVVSER